MGKLLSFVAISALLASACGGGGPGPVAAPGSPSAAPPTTVADIALYAAADRQKVLEAGAKNEGTVSLYTSAVAPTMPLIIEAFQAKYPFLKVEMYRADNAELNQRFSQEEQAGKRIMDVLETTTDGMTAFISNKWLQPYASPETAAYPKDSLHPQAIWAPTRASYVGLGYNTKLVSKADAPKTFDDLLDPKWKGKMSIASSATGVRFVGNVLFSKGEDYLKKLGAQNVRVQNVSGRALADLVVAGEIPLSPTIFDSHVADSKSQGAPIEWVPLEPTVVNLAAATLSAKAPHPNASMLFIDFLLSEQGQKIYFDHGYGSTRNGIGAGAATFKKLYLENVTPSYEESFAKWQALLRSTFTAQR